MSSSVRLGETNGLALKTAELVILPLGSTEYHGAHAPTGTDSIIAQAIAEEVAKRVDGVVVPVVTYGYSVLHQDYPGTIGLKASTLTAVMYDVLSSLVHQGVKRILIVNGHDGNIPSMTTAALDVRRENPDVLILATTWWEITRQDPSVRQQFGKYGGKGHGGAEETAIVMAAGVGEVDLSKAESAEMILHHSAGSPAPFLRNDLVIVFRDVSEITGMGFEGYPAEATAEKGRFILDKVVERLVEFIQELQTQDWHLHSA